jgi:DNA-directed RNA polymerase subunit RPC12/RpoP
MDSTDEKQPQQQTQEEKVLKMDPVKALLNSIADGDDVRCRECNGRIFVEGHKLTKRQGQLYPQPFLLCQRCGSPLPIFIVRNATNIPTPQGPGH